MEPKIREKFAEIIQRKKLTDIVLSRPIHIFYYSGFQPSKYLPAISIVRKERNDLLIIPSEEKKRAEQCVSNTEIITYNDTAGNIPPNFEREIASALAKTVGSTSAMVGIEPGHLPLRWAQALVSCGLVDIEKDILSIRQSKTEMEIKKLEKAVQIAEFGQQAAKVFLHQDITPLKLLARARAAMEIESGEKIEVDTELKIASNNNLVKSIQLKFGDWVVIRMCPKIEGYCSIVTRSNIFGPVEIPSNEILLGLGQILSETQNLLVPNLPIGEIIKNIKQLAEKILSNSELIIKGHGIGLEFVEAPWFNENNQETLKPGMTIILELITTLPEAKGQAAISSEFVVTSNFSHILGEQSFLME